MLRLKVFEMACLRRMACMSRRQRIRNGDIKERLDVMSDLQQRLQIRRLRYFRHVERMGPDRHIALHGWVEGVRSRCRPQRSWHIGKTIVEATRLARNRQEWRSFVMKRRSRPHAPCLVYSVALAPYRALTDTPALSFAFLPTPGQCSRMFQMNSRHIVGNFLLVEGDNL